MAHQVDITVSIQDGNQVFQPSFARGLWPKFARGLWPKSSNASFSPKSMFSWTNQTANKGRRQKKRVQISLNFTYCTFIKITQCKKAAGNSSSVFEEIYLPDLWVAKFGCLFKYLMVPKVMAS